jgi:hypothetical protein
MLVLISCLVFSSVFADSVEYRKTGNFVSNLYSSPNSTTPIKKIPANTKLQISEMKKVRQGMLINSLNDTANQHGAGWFYHTHDRIKKSFPIYSLSLNICLTYNSRKIESEILKFYREEFGELPPLNLQQ